MIIPRHRVCNFCGEEVGSNKRYFIIKSKDIISCYAGTVRDNRKYDMCEDCMREFAKYLQSKWKVKKNETRTVETKND